MAVEQELNLTPSPRVLRMLGRIEFAPWQCLAELIDNSVDAFLSHRAKYPDAGSDYLFPQVNVELSPVPQIKAGKGDLRVTDNGPGMSPEFLEDAVRAGYSSNDSVEKLGLFGMGFNVATARLGARTEVWTTRADDDVWHGVRIDFDEMEAAKSFRVPALVRKKLATEEGAHGTEVVVSKLDKDRAAYLRSAAGIRSTKAKLSRVYNKIMRESSLKVVLMGSALEPREFCVWDPSRFVDTKGEFGRIGVRLDIDVDLGDRLYCDDCWVWLTPKETECPSCLKTTNLQERSRRVKGWLGIQRFFSMTDYGVDLIRNGRVIEERSKTFFSWVNPETDEVLPEYPIEQTHWGGRVVGELSIDFVPLASHQKDAFDKASQEWRQVVEAVRGKGPILQQIRRNLGFQDRNLSPLARLHAGYRRGQPAGLRTLVPGDATGRGFNKTAEQWAGLFWQGDPDYQTDEKWYEAVLVAEEVNNKGKGADVPRELAGDQEFEPGDSEPQPEVETGPEGEKVPPPPEEPSTEADPSLTGAYELSEVPGAPRLEVTSSRLLKGHLTDRRPFEFAAVANRVTFTYDPNHPLFAQSLTEPVDCLVDEVAYQLLERSNAAQSEWPLSLVADAVRRKYFPWRVDAYEVIREEAASFLGDCIEHYCEKLSYMQPLGDDLLDADAKRTLAQAVAAKDHGGAERVKEVVETGQFPRYLGPRYVPVLIRQWPELVCDGNFLITSFQDVDEDLRPSVVDKLVPPISDLIWVANPDGARSGGREWRNLLGRAVSSLRLLQGWRAT